MRLLKQHGEDVVLRMTISPEKWWHPGANAIHLEVSRQRVLIRDQIGEIQPVCSDNSAHVLDADQDCLYWFSLDAHNRRLYYGKGEVRLETKCLEVLIPGQQGPCSWIDQLSVMGYDNVSEAIIMRDPLVAPLPLKVVGTDEITMDDVARGALTVPAGLAPEAQILYSFISGKKFELNTPEFPDFVQAIEASIKDPNGWCNRVLEAKASEFGVRDPSATYLRITLGENQGESPGIPYVLEIWPPGHHSPIHNHAGAHAVIRVLHGAITVSLYSMLSIHHQLPICDPVVFEAGSVTWISPGLNQTHKLQNNNPDGSTCMTVQCYAYGNLDDRSHYEYFDYIDNSGLEIRHFEPNSDLDFVTFKMIMHEEHLKRSSQAG